MGWFKRLCLFVYGLAGILALLALSLPWVGPYTQEATSLLYVPDYFRALEVVVGITGVGCLICLLRALFTPRNYKNVIIATEAGDQITVTRSAIASQAQHIVERDGTCVAGTVRVRAKKRGSIRVFVRVTPKRPLDVVAKGRELQAELDEGLARIAADKIKSVNLEFTDPQDMEDEAVGSLSAPSDSDYAAAGSYEPAGASEAIDPAPAAYAPTPRESPAESGITVSMSSFHREEAAERPEAGAAAPDGSQASERDGAGAPPASEGQAPASEGDAPADVDATEACASAGGTGTAGVPDGEAPASGEGDE